MIDRPRRPDAGLPLIGGGLILLAAMLVTSVGFPRLPTAPTRLPSLIDVELFLRSPSLEQETALLTIAGLAAWLVWVWFALTVVARVVVVLCERAGADGIVVGALRAASDRLTLPVVRRTVDASVGALLIARVAGGWPAPSALAEQTAPRLVQVAAAPATLDDDAHLASGDLLYSVRGGDSLGKIARRYYGDEAAYSRIYEANRDRLQQDGRILRDAGMIYPGWTLVIPDPTSGIESDSEGHRYCTVRPGDSLISLAADTLGDGQRWTELFELNRGLAASPDGRILTDPALVWPGMRLQLPDAFVIATQPAPNNTATADPVQIVAQYYHLVDERNFDDATALMRDGGAGWRTNASTLESQARLRILNATLRSIDANQRRAAVEVDLIATADEPELAERYSVTWQLARGPDGWKLATSEVKPY